MFGILLRPLPVLENVEIINLAFLQIIYLLFPEITYYLVIGYTLMKLYKLQSNLVNKFVCYLLITPNILISLKLILFTLSNVNIFLKQIF